MFKSLFRTGLIGFTPKYIPVINGLRGFASLSVCVFHLICLPLNFLEHTLVYQVAPLGRYGVQVFFVITGVVIPMLLLNENYKYSSIGRFMLKRIIRIEPPYLFAIIGAILFIFFRNQFLAKIPHNIPLTKSLLLHIGYLIPFVKGEKWLVIVFWTMAVEFQYYIIISLLFPLFVARRTVTRLISYLAIFGLSTAFTNSEFALVWMPVFMIGVIYISFLFAKVNRFEFWIVLCTSICLSAFLHGYIIAFVSIGTLAVIHFLYNYKTRTSDFFGKISYSLYLIHTILGTAVINFFVPHASSIFVKLLIVLLGLVVSIGSAYIVYLFVERPFKKYASKISLKPNVSKKDESERDIYKRYKLKF